MERKEREEKLAVKAEQTKRIYDRGARSLQPLLVGDMVRIQNQTTTRKTKWDRVGKVLEVLPNKQYNIMVSGSRRITTRNRRHLRKIPDTIKPTQKVCPSTQPQRGAVSGKSSPVTITFDSPVSNADDAESSPVSSPKQAPSDGKVGEHALPLNQQQGDPPIELPSNGEEGEPAMPLVQQQGDPPTEFRRSSRVKTLTKPWQYGDGWGREWRRQFK